MESFETRLHNLLSEYGSEIEWKRSSIKAVSTASIDENVPNKAGVYWIETNMPTAEMQKAISDVTGKQKKTRTNPPVGTSLIDQQNGGIYIVYSGTEENINKRLKQHLFNQGNVDTAKLGCVIDDEPFSNYEWRISFEVIESYELRYAIEAWWRLNHGWPKFCLR